MAGSGLYLVTEEEYSPRMSDERTCSQCHETKPADEFFVRRARPSGRSSGCKTCLKLKRDAIRPELQAKGRAYMAKRRRENPELVRAQTRKGLVTWRRRHPEKQRQSQKDWYSSERGQWKTRERFLLKNYGITLGEYDAMLLAQDGKCAICRKAETTRGTRNDRKPRLLGVDHDHDSGQVRGLLCTRCNVAIGMLDHNPHLLNAAIAYLALNAYRESSGGL